MSFLSGINRLLGGLVGGSSTTFGKGIPSSEAVTPFTQLLSDYIGRGQRESNVSMPAPFPSPLPPAPSPMQTPQPRTATADYQAPPTTEDIEGKIRGRYSQYGGEELPAMQYVPQMMEAAQNYDVFEQNPYLLPALSILETSGGQNVTRPNNLLNWGVNYPGNNELFEQMTMEDVLGRMISGLGERSPYYEGFREDPSNLESFANTYEPANPDYLENLLSTIASFENYQ